VKINRIAFMCKKRKMKLSLCPSTGSGAHPAPYLMGTEGTFPGVKWPGRESYHSPPSSAEVKEWGSYTSTPPYAFMAWYLVKHRDNFTFYLYLYPTTSS
jgi:hypothetical protein